MKNIAKRLEKLYSQPGNYKIVKGLRFIENVDLFDPDLYSDICNAFITDDGEINHDTLNEELPWYEGYLTISGKLFGMDCVGVIQGDKSGCARMIAFG